LPCRRAHLARAVGAIVSQNQHCLAGAHGSITSGERRFSAILDHRSEATVVKTGITVIAYITAKSGHEDEVRDALLNLVAQARKEKGCINYDLHQSPEIRAQFLMCENWQTSADLDAHSKAAPLQAFVRIAGSLLERPAEVSKWIMVSELS
jgi:quinol monooxygenase YgiN